MDNPNPIYYRDLVTPDNAITDLIKQLQDLIAQYDAAKAKIQGAAAEMAQGMKNVSSATEEQRDQIKLSYEQSDKLVKSYRDVTTAQWQVTQAFIEQTKAKKDGEKIDKLIVQINTSAEGSYNRLSAQYRLNKIRLNELSDAERAGTEAGRKLEAETNAIYEQMNKLQLATGKAQLQVGHYERGLLSAVGVNGKFADAVLDSSKASEMFHGVMGAIKSPLGAVVGVIGAGVAAFKLFKESIQSTQTTSDGLAFAMAELNGVWDRFAKSVASMDFSGFIRGAAESARAGRELAMVLDEVFERTNSVTLLRSALSAENAALEEAAKNTALSYDERLAAANKYIDNVIPLYEQEVETAKRVRDAQLNNLFTLSNQRKFATDEEKKQAEEEFAANIQNYNLNERLIAQANEYIATEKKKENAIRMTGQQGGYIYISLVEDLQKQLDATDDSVKAFVEFAKQYNLTSDAQVKAYVDAQVAYNNSQAALYNENKRFVTLKNNLEAQQTKEAEAQAKARTEAAKKAAEEQKKAAEEKAKADQKAAEDAKKAAQEQINAQNALLQAQLQSINLQIAVTYEGTQEMLQLRLDAINKQREIELFANKQKAEELRKDEKAINAKYDAQVLKETSDFHTQLAQREFDAQQDLDEANFELLQTTEAEKTRFRLQQEKERLQKILELNETASEKLTDTEIKAIKATIAGIDKEMGKAGRGKQDFYDLVGIKWDDDQKSAMNEATSEILDNVSSIIDAWAEAAEARVDAAQTSVDAAQTELDAEIEARNNGYANNVTQAQKNLDLEKKNLEDAQKEKEKATKAQLALDTITQTASLITASANIWSSLSSIPVVGPALAVAALATMWGSFAISKVKAAQVASTGTETYGEGTVELLQGGSHASGHDIDMGTTNDGKRRRAEGGEFFAVINKRNSRRYRDVIPDVINAFNDGSFADKYERANASMSGLAVNLLAGGSSTDVSKLERDVRAIRTQGAESRYVDGAGNTIVRYKNLTRIIRNS